VGELGDEVGDVQDVDEAEEALLGLVVNGQGQDVVLLNLVEGLKETVWNRRKVRFGTRAEVAHGKTNVSLSFTRKISLRGRMTSVTVCPSMKLLTSETVLNGERSQQKERRSPGRKDQPTQQNEIASRE
jgi:hypothetical protein